MIRFIYWRYHAKNEEEHEDDELFDVLREAMYLNDHGEAWIESITLPDGTVLDGAVDADAYYENHRSDEHAIEGSVIVLNDQLLIEQAGKQEV